MWSGPKPARSERSRNNALASCTNRAPSVSRRSQRTHRCSRSVGYTRVASGVIFLLLGVVFAAAHPGGFLLRFRGSGRRSATHKVVQITYVEPRGPTDAADAEIPTPHGTPKCCPVECGMLLGCRVRQPDSLLCVRLVLLHSAPLPFVAYTISILLDVSLYFNENSVEVR